MTDTQTQLLKGALKSAVSAATGLIVSLPIADPNTFAITSVGGWKHLGFVILVVTIVGEARFWKQWADSEEPLETKLQARLDQAQSATKDAVVAAKSAQAAVTEAKSVVPPPAEKP
jgi:hypothetical protein